MKRKKIIKVIFLTLALLTFCSIPIILNFTVGQKTNNNQKINLTMQRVAYFASVEDMTSITEKEATTIKDAIHKEINKTMTKLNLKENIDYKIINLDTIKSGANLRNIKYNIKVSSNENSNKATGSFTISWTIQENISNWKIRTFNINRNEVDGLSGLTARFIVQDIHLNTTERLNKGQNNKENKDYVFINLNLIREKAKFKDYYDKISVKGISNQLTGTFPIKFEIK